ncbi:hypothetical protein [Nitratireductor sp. XY-223]|uniref:hypothetical protein n=1 Tax=Nitratireductor sp. XY-223 TaxID=2561926 RepID=UPI0010A9A033|nr:hypothetical protein [Nitratireductor sp. XY-223]
MSDRRSAKAEVSPVPLRAPDEVMRLSRLGAFYPTRLSFMRTLIRRLNRDRARVSRPVWEIDDEGYGRAVYSIDVDGHRYSLAAFSNRLSAEQRTDRVIAEAWDTSFALFDGEPTAADLDRLEANAPRQEAGRFEATELVLSRANKSVRFFDHVVERLARGQQPDETLVGSVGYLMRTTAVYGNGKFGIADRTRLADRGLIGGSFQAEMLTVWMIRGFSHDLVEHIARCRAPETFVPLERRLRRHLGIGNATGLGMAPFLVTHPALFNNWVEGRETALARVRAAPMSEPDVIARATELMDRAERHLGQWSVDDHRQMARIETVRREWRELRVVATADWLSSPLPWQRLFDLAADRSAECQELVVALLLECHGNLVDDLADNMMIASEPALDSSMSVDALLALCRTHFGWALDIDFSDRSETHLFWYVSEEKLEPRLGNRYEEAGAELEIPLDIGRQVQHMARDIGSADRDLCVAEFLIKHPQHRHAVRRVQGVAQLPYAEIRDNLLGRDCLPIDMLRCKLSFFGASKFDPKSDRWTRITLYQGAPLFDEIADENADDWWLPVLTCRQ